MADPITAAIMVATAVAGAASDFNAADAQADALDQQAQLANQQAKAQAAQEDREVRRQLGVSRALGGASGTVLSGSRVDALEDQTTELLLTPATTLQRGRTQALDLRGRADLTRDQALANLGTSLLGAATSDAAAPFRAKLDSAFSAGSGINPRNQNTPAPGPIRGLA